MLSGNAGDQPAQKQVGQDRQREGDEDDFARIHEARTVGLFLVGLGTLAMVMGTVEYWFAIKGMQSVASVAIWKRPSFVMALIISFVGLGVFVSIIAHLL